MKIKNKSVAGHFLLTQLLMSKLKSSDQGRIINVSAEAHANVAIHLDNLNLEGGDFKARLAFGQSKLALLLMTRWMGRLLRGKNKI